MAYEVKEVKSTARKLGQELSLRELATQYHYAVSTVFGEDIRSSGIDGAIRSQTENFLAESIALVRGEDEEDISAYLEKQKSRLRKELREALMEYGINNPKMSKNIGPILPTLLAIAHHEYEDVNIEI